MDVAKDKQLAGNLAGVTFWIGFSLLALWNCSQETLFMGFFQNPIIWAGLGVFSSLLSLGFYFQFQRTLSLASETSHMPTSLSEGFQLFVQLKHADQSLAQLLAGVLVLLASIYLNFHSLKSGESKLTAHLGYFVGGWLVVLPLAPLLKKKLGVLEDSSSMGPDSQNPQPSRMKGSFLVQETDQGFELTQPMVGATPPDLYSFSVQLKEVSCFKVMRTQEESNLTYSRRIEGNLELLGKALAAKMKFTFQPQTRPNYLIDALKWNPGDVYVHIQGPDLFYYLPVQSQYLAVLTNLESRFKKHGPS